MRGTMFKANEIIYQNNDWISLVFLAVLVLLTLAKFLYNERIIYLNSYFLSKNYFLMYFNREKSIKTGGFSKILFLIQLVTFAMLLYYLNNFYQFNSKLSNFNGFLTAFLFVSVYLIGSYFLGLLFSFAFDLKEIHRKIAFEKFNYFNNLILWILPMLALTEYLELYNFEVFKVTVILTILLLISRYVLLFLNNKKLVYNDLFYFILYLCALEIAPLIIFIKLTI